jgi:hypothetical protein
MSFTNKTIIEGGAAAAHGLKTGVTDLHNAARRAR